MAKELKYLEEGKKFKRLIESRNMTPYRFSMACLYSPARLYRLISGEDDIRTVQTYNIAIFCRILGINTMDEFFKALDIDLIKEIA